MTTKTVTLTIQKVLEGAAVDDDMPVGWLDTFYERARKLIPADEWPNARLRGASGIRIEFPHKLTEVEQLQDELAAHRAKADEFRALLHPDGTLVPDAAARLRELLG